MSTKQGLDVKPFKADIVAFLFKLLFSNDVAVEFRVSAEKGPTFPCVCDGTTQTMGSKL